MSRAIYASLVVCLAVYTALARDVAACEGAKHIRLNEAVLLDAHELAALQALPPLRIHSADAPPMSAYNAARRAYGGIGVDVWCFIASHLGLEYQIIPGRDMTVAGKIREVQDGQADVFLPLSLTPEREQRGVFTLPYYESHYAVIARQEQPLAIRSVSDLAQYRVGIIGGVALESIIAEQVPGIRLHVYDHTTSDALFQDVREGVLDAAVFSKRIFLEKRYHHEYFDLGVVHTLSEYPRSYRFYFSDTAQHRRLAQAFDRYLAVMDVSDAVHAYQDGERALIERYVAQRSQRKLLQNASVAAALLALAFYVILRRYRRLSRLLAASNKHIMQQQHALQTAYKELETQNRTDSLTQLANRRHFDQTLKQEFERSKRTGLPLSLLLVDVDHFKSVNDHYGHAVGDDYLRKIAQILTHSVTRPGDVAARYGGEEFACLLPDTGLIDARFVAQRIRAAVAAQALPHPLANTPHVTLSIGIATLAGGNAGPDDLLAEADAQLYAAKHAGRNRIFAAVVDVAAATT